MPFVIWYFLHAFERFFFGVLISRSCQNFRGNYNSWSPNIPGNHDFEVLISRSPNLLLHRFSFVTSRYLHHWLGVTTRVTSFQITFYHKHCKYWNKKLKIPHKIISRGDLELKGWMWFLSNWVHFALRKPKIALFDKYVIRRESLENYFWNSDGTKTMKILELMQKKYCLKLLGSEILIFPISALHSSLKNKRWLNFTIFYMATWILYHTLSAGSSVLQRVGIPDPCSAVCRSAPYSTIT